MVDEGWLVAEAASRLGLSQPTVRRRVGKDLDAVPGARPLRITKASVERVRRATLDSLGVHADSHAQSADMHQSHVDDLRIENEALRGVIQSLRLANQALNDALGQLTAPRIPNN